MKNLLLDVNIVVDVCAQREPWCRDSAEAMARCLDHGGRLWLYVGSVQTMEYVLASELFQQERDEGVSFTDAMATSRDILADFCKDKSWLAALAGEGSVYAAKDPEDEQLVISLQRFPHDSIKLLTRDKGIAAGYPELTVSPAQYLQYSFPTQPLPFLDLPAQQDVIRPDLEKRIHTVLQHGKYILGPEVTELEAQLRTFTGAKHAITCSSGSDALLMALMALDVGPGDAVFTTPFTFVATADVIARLGATPIFVDIDPTTYNIDPAKLEAAIAKVRHEQRATSNEPSTLTHPIQPLQHIQPSQPNIQPSQPNIQPSQPNIQPPQPNIQPSQPQTHPLQPKAIIVVDLYGLPCDYDAIEAVAKKYGLAVIQDGAQSFGASYKGRQTGTLGDISCTSFFPSKPLGGYGDGGACFTSNDDLAAKLRSIRVHGQGQNKYDTVRLGIKGRMDTLQAAIVLAKLAVYPQELEAKQKMADLYSNFFLLPPSSFSLPLIPPGMKSAWALYTILCPSTDHRTTVQVRLKEQGIPNVVYYAKPLHLQPVFAHLGYNPGDFPVSEDCAQRVLSLPMHGYMGERDVERIVEAMKD